MRNGFVVCALFAACWAGAGLVLSGYPLVWLALPVAISALLLGWAWRQPGTNVSRAEGTGKLVGRWSLVEGVAIAVTANVLTRLGLADTVISAVAIIVGLHFLPLARGLPAPPYYATGSALVAIGAVGLLLPAGVRPMAVGMGAAAVLWLTMIAVILIAGRRAIAVA